MQWNQLQTKTDRRHIAEPDRAKLRWHHHRCGRQAAVMHLPGQASGRACPPLTLQLLSSAGLGR